MNFIQLSRTNETAAPFFVNVAHILKFGCSLNSDRTIIYYSNGTSESVIETEEEVIELIKQSTNTIVAQVEKIC